MKKVILTLSALICTYSFGITSISCPSSYSSTTVGTCTSCFKEELYSGQSYGNLYDTFGVTGTGQRLMYFDETGVNWSLLNSNFNLTSSLSTDRTATNGFKRSVLTVPSRMGWFTSASDRKYAVFQAGDSGVKYVESAGGITFVGPNSGAIPSMS